MHYYNPLDKFCKSITGAVPENTDVTFRVKAYSDNCRLVIKNDYSEEKRYFQMKKNGDLFEITAKFECGLFWYCFDLGYGKFIGCGNGLEGEYTETPSSYQLSVYKGDYFTPDWLKGGIIYQIFPDRFCRGQKEKTVENGKVFRNDWFGTPVFMPNEHGKVVNNDFFGGDFQGVTEKLGYLKSLNVTAIYLNPVFKAYSNHRYDTGDYMSFDSLLGTEEDFKKLVSTADDLGIKIILDGVFNHTGDDSVYFNKYGNYSSVGAYQSKDSPYYNWFDFKNYPDNYSSWWGITTLPSVNKNNPDYIDFITGAGGVIEKYTATGIGGWRLDVVDELPDGFVKKIRDSVKRINKNAVIIGEVWEDASNKISYGVRREYFLGDELDSVMNYPLKNAILNYIMHGDCSVLRDTVKEQIDHYPKSVLDSLMNILSTHDTCRLLSAVGGVNIGGKSKKELSETYIAEYEYKNAVNRLKIASLLQYTLPGVPSIYYGDEAGMQGYCDPLNRRCFPWGKEDKEITEWFKKIGNVRTDYSAFVSGDFYEIYADGGVYAFKRCASGSEVFVAVNLSEDAVNIDFDGELLSLISDNSYNNGFKLNKNKFEVLIRI